MLFYDISPGSLLQRLYIKSRLRKLKESFSGKPIFIEVGAGRGINSKLFLDMGFKGYGFDLNHESCVFNNNVNSDYINKGDYQVINEDFLLQDNMPLVDIIFSCMVIEHLSSQKLNDFFTLAKKLLNPRGMIITLVPAGMRFWGIEDEISGHFKRYDYSCFDQIANKFDFKLNHIAGITYPLSNILLGLSNFLVKKNEGHKLKLTQEEQTKESGFRAIKYKNYFPAWTSLFLNEIMMLPFHLLQCCFRSKNKNAMIIYCELRSKIVNSAVDYNSKGQYLYGK